MPISVPIKNLGCSADLIFYIDLICLYVSNVHNYCETND